MLTEGKPTLATNSMELIRRVSVKKSPNATMFLKLQMYATKNKTVEYLDNLDKEHHKDILKKVIKFEVTRESKSKISKRIAT